MGKFLMVSGQITKIEPNKQIGGSAATLITIPVNDRIQVDGQWVDETDWVELTGWDADAAKWAEKYRVGDTIEVRGVPKFRGYQGKDRETGQTVNKVGITIKHPWIEWCPGGRNQAVRADEQRAPVSGGSQINPNETDFDDVPF